MRARRPVGDRARGFRNDWSAHEAIRLVLTFITVASFAACASSSAVGQKRMVIFAAANCTPAQCRADGDALRTYLQSVVNQQTANTKTARSITVGSAFVGALAAIAGGVSDNKTGKWIGVGDGAAIAVLNAISGLRNLNSNSADCAGKIADAITTYDIADKTTAAGAQAAYVALRNATNVQEARCDEYRNAPMPTGEAGQ